jgi:predicted metal-dependent hydrolase
MRVLELPQQKKCNFMEHHRIIHDNTVLEFVITRSKKRRRTIAIHVSTEKGVEVKVPYATRLERIKDLIIARLTWIQQRLNALPVPETIQSWYERDILFYQGKAYPLIIDTFPFAKKRGECVFTGTQFTVTLAQGLSESSKQQLFKKTLETWYREQAELRLRERTAYFAELMQVRPRGILIKTQRRRWGSCSAHNVIRYNWKIIMATPELLDYLVVHELAHIKIKNHGKNFWRLLAMILPDYQWRRKSLHEFGQGMTAS